MKSQVVGGSALLICIGALAVTLNKCLSRTRIYMESVEEKLWRKTRIRVNVKENPVSRTHTHAHSSTHRVPGGCYSFHVSVFVWCCSEWTRLEIVIYN